MPTIGQANVSLFGWEIPLLVAAALLGSGITLIGVFVQNLFETWRHRQKLNHEAVQKRQEREMNLRREVYLKATEELAKNFRYLNTFGDFAIPIKEHSALVEKLGEATSKLHMVASQETIAKLMYANEQFFRATLELNRLRLPILKLRHKSDSIAKRIGDQAGQHDQILQHLRAASLPPAEISKAVDVLKAIRTDIEKLEVEQNEIENALPRLTAELWRKSHEASFEYGARQVEVNVLIRRELGLPLDESEYRRMMSESLAMARTELLKFTEDVFREATSDPLLPKPK